MPYTDASGVQIPVGTDAFNPTSQFKTWQDKNATYNNDVTVAIDTDRTALAAPVRRNGLRCYVQSTKTLWLYDGGWHRVSGGHTPLQLDTTNSTPFMTTQCGIGKVAGVATLYVSTTVTFPAAFASTPVVTANHIGGRLKGAFNPAGLIQIAQPVVGSPSLVTLTGFKMEMQRTDGADQNASYDYYFAWSATGVLA